MNITLAAAITINNLISDSFIIAKTVGYIYRGFFIYILRPDLRYFVPIPINSILAEKKIYFSRARNRFSCKFSAQHRNTLSLSWTLILWYGNVLVWMVGCSLVGVFATLPLFFAGKCALSVYVYVYVIHYCQIYKTFMLPFI